MTADSGGLRSLYHVGRAVPAGKRDDELAKGLGNHALIAHYACCASPPVPFRRKSHSRTPFLRAHFPAMRSTPRAPPQQSGSHGAERRASDPASSR